MEVEVLPHVQLPVERVLLGDDAKQLLGQRRVCDDVDAADIRVAGGGDHTGGEHPGGRRLAGAVGPEQAEYLAGLNAQIEPVDRGEVGAGVDLRQLLSADDFTLAPPPRGPPRRPPAVRVVWGRTTAAKAGRG